MEIKVTRKLKTSSTLVAVGDLRKLIEGLADEAVISFSYHGPSGRQRGPGYLTAEVDLT